MSTTVPLFDTKRQNAALAEACRDIFDAVYQSGQYIMGPQLEAFEAQVADYLDVPHALGVSSGTDALLLALMALEIGPGDEVICPSFTFFATAGSVARVGATPVFADCCPVCYNLDTTDLEKRLTSRTKAIMPVHLFGQAAEMDALLAFAKTHHLHVIEDAAQAIGSAYRGRKVGGIGDCGAFSFFPTKNLGGFGDSGLFVCHDDALAERARILRVHGMHPRYLHHHIGANFRMDPLQAGLLAVKLPHLENYNRARAANADFYHRHLSGIPGIMMADAFDCACAQAPEGKDRPEALIVLPVAYPYNHVTWNQFTLRVRQGRRDALRTWLHERGIGAEIYYPRGLHEQPCFAHLPKERLPNTETISAECLSIPIFPELTETERTTVAEAIIAFVQREY